MSSRPLVIAHRTCPRDTPENSLAGIVKAIELGADAVELDVRRTSDGRPVLLHDRWLLRTASRPLRVDRVSEARITRMRLRGGGMVPTLASALAALGPHLKVAIDVKDGGAADAVISETRNQDLTARTLFWSQHEAAVRLAASRAPELEVTLLRDTRGPEQLHRFLADARSFGARGVSARWSQVTPSLAETCAGQGMRLYAWCKTPSIDRRKLSLLHGIVTDWPAAARAEVDTRGGLTRDE